MAIAAAMSCTVRRWRCEVRYAETEGEVDTVPFGCYPSKVWDVRRRFDETVDGADETATTRG